MFTTNVKYQKGSRELRKADDKTVLKLGKFQINNVLVDLKQ